MKKFELPDGTYIVLTKATPRKECHGDQHVQAISLRLAWTTTNESLSKLHPQLKDMLFWKTPSEDAQERIDGVPEITPNLRCPTVATPLAIGAEFSGYTLTIDHGIDESSALELYQCVMDKFKVDPKEGGSVIISWSVSSNKSVTPELVGALCGLESEEVTVLLAAPKVQADAIDGTQEAFNRDHPDNDGPLFDEDAQAQSATDAFIRSGTDEGLGNGDDDHSDDHAEVEEDPVPPPTGRRARRSAQPVQGME